MTFRRTIVLRTEGEVMADFRCVGRIDDHFHGFEVVLEGRAGVVEHARATGHRLPWTTCGGALPSVSRLDGPLENLRGQLASAPKDTTCVHVNDLTTLTSRAHRDRRYDVACDRERVTVERDGDLLVSWSLDRWVVTEPGPYEGLWFTDPRWGDVLDANGADDDEREAVFVARRGILVAIGYFDLDWEEIGAGHKITYDVMSGSCHSFTEPQLSRAVSLVEPPRLP